MPGVSGSRNAKRRIFELGQPLHVGVPRGPVHPPFMYSLSARHGDGASLPGMDPEIGGASDAFSMGTHTGTHMDSLAHCSYSGRLHDGTDVTAPGVQDESRGIQVNSGSPLGPIVARGVLLDFPALLGVELVPDEYAITPSELERAEKLHGVNIGAGDVALLRTGRDRLWGDPDAYLRGPLPGPTPGTARLLRTRGVVATGSDTVAYEQAPSASPLEVHAELLARGGIFILECLNLAELSAAGVYEFEFVALPLRIAGATGSPVNPIAVA